MMNHKICARRFVMLMSNQNKFKLMVITSFVLFILSADINENDSVDFNVFLILMSKSRDATAQVLSEEEAKRRAEAEMRHAFQVFDRDGNGLIDSKELRLTMKTLGEKLSKSDVKAMIKAADMNGDGKIDYEGQTQSSCSIFQG